jgi:hypothetical protein
MIYSVLAINNIFLLFYLTKQYEIIIYIKGEQNGEQNE